MGMQDLVNGVKFTSAAFVFCVGLVACTPPATQSDNPEVNIPLAAEVLLRSIDTTSVKISPDGQTLAFLKRDGERANIWLSDINQLDVSRPLITNKGRGVRSYEWANDGRSLVYMSGANGALGTGNTGGDNFVLYRLDVGTGESFALTEKLDGRAKYQLSKAKPDTVFISPSNRGKRARTILTTKISTGEVTEITNNDGHAPVYADANMEGRFSTHWREKLGYDIFTRATDGTWKTALEIDFADRLNFKFFGMSADGHTAYLTHTKNRDRGALVALDVETGNEVELAHQNDAMIVDVMTNQNTGVPMAYKSEHLRSQWTALDTAYKSDFKRLQKFNDGNLVIESRSADDDVWVVSYVSPTALRSYYLYKRGDVPQPLFADENDQKDVKLAPTYPVSTRTHDGLDVTGYLTLPLGSDANHDGIPDKALPTIVWVHGGPWGRTDYAYDTWAQWVASRGYAALNVNFRGSTGFGKKHITSHYGEWGGEMTRDVLTLIDWAVKQGISDSEKLAVAGESYGGYGTLSLITAAPDKFKCAVTSAALSDLGMYVDTLVAYTGRFPEADLNARHLTRLDRERMQFGADERTEAGRAHLAARSPITKVDRIKTPLLMFHMVRDQGVVIKHTEQIVEGLEGRDVPVTFLTFADEGHIIRKRNNQLSFYPVVDAFLAPCLGGASYSVTQEDISHGTLALRTGGEHVAGLQGAFEQKEMIREKTNETP